MILFQSDYLEGCHPNILERLQETNLEQTVGYGEDEYCQKAAGLIIQKCQNPELKVHFMTGGTQANMTIIDAGLRSHQGVIAAATGHIHVHETGAVESLGHKVLALEHTNGKITAEQIRKICAAHREDASFEHTVQPKMVYLSQSTELGTIYYQNELREIYDVCREYGLFLFIDGARLAYSLMAKDNDVTLPILTECCDAFTIGGTKAGALFGEAIVLKHKALQEDFRYFIKQKGGMLAKGRLLGIQFLALLEEDLFLKLGAHGDRMADRLRDAFSKKGYPFLAENYTNQIFVVMPDHHLDQLSHKYGFSYQERVDESHSAVRFCTSWVTKEEHIDLLVEDIYGLE